jgi:hypothetical protein
MSTNLTLITVLVTVIHVIALAVMIWIRVRRTEGDGIHVPSPKVIPCAVCGEPSTDWAYDGLDPNEQLDSHTGKAWSPDVTHYLPVCAAHRDPGEALRKAQAPQSLAECQAGGADGGQQ